MFYSVFMCSFNASFTDWFETSICFSVFLSTIFSLIEYIFFFKDLVSIDTSEPIDIITINIEKYWKLISVNLASKSSKIDDKTIEGIQTKGIFKSLNIV